MTRIGDNLTERFAWRWGEAAAAQERDWQKIGAVAMDGTAGRDQVTLRQAARYRLIKLRCRGVDVEVNRWTLRFEDGAILDLSVNCLLAGTESRPMLILGRRLRGVVVEYAPRWATRRGRLEIWAQA